MGAHCEQAGRAVTYVPGRAGHSGYEFRPVSYMSFACRMPAVHVIPEWDALQREIEQLFAYGTWTDCEMLDWEDRANAEDCWCDWWKAPWVKAAWAAGLGPERCEWCEEAPCCGAALGCSTGAT